MAPEQTRGEPVDQRADIYSLGLVLFEIFTGAPAFSGDTPMIIALKQIQEAPPDPRHIDNMLPEHVGATILRCLEKDPSKRFQSVEAVRAALLNEPAAQIDARRLRARLLEAIVLVLMTAVVITAGVAFSRKTNAEAEIAAFRLAQSSDTEEAWKKFLETYRQGQMVAAAEDRLVQLRFRAVENAQTTSAENLDANGSPQDVVPANSESPMPGKAIPRAPQPQPAAIDNARAVERKPREEWAAFVDTALIPGGIFTMGSDGGKEDENPAHRVRLNSFRMSTTEITNRQYLAFLEDTGHPRPKDPAFAKRYLTEYPDLPVVNVSYQDTVDFCKWVRQKFAVAARLPTEAEWEYAALGRRDEDQLAPRSPKDVSRYRGNKTGGVPTVGRAVFPPNGFGLYNMSGNVWEWVSDFYSKDYYQISPITNPVGPPSGTKRVIRGGSWADGENQLRSFHRASRDPNDRNDQIGFRIVIAGR
jgi:formylglycine-generating enzyme required for sulfatase activity